MLAQVKIARERVGAVRAALRSATPEEIGGCLPLLDEAIGCLHAVPTAPHDPELAGELDALQFELGVARRLIEGSAEFYRGWAGVLATAAAGYTPAGEPAALTAPGSVCLEG